MPPKMKNYTFVLLRFGFVCYLGRHFLILWSLCESVYLNFCLTIKKYLPKVVALYIFWWELIYLKQMHKLSARTELYGLKICRGRYELKLYKNNRGLKITYIYITNDFFLYCHLILNSFIDSPFFESISKQVNSY